MSYWDSKNLEMDLGMETEDVIEQVDDGSTPFNTPTPSVLQNTTGASLNKESEEKVEGSEVRTVKKKVSKLRNKNDTSSGQKVISIELDPSERMEVEGEPLLEIEKDDDIVNELGIALKLIINFLDNWKGLQRLALSNAIRQILTDHLNVLLRIRDDIKGNIGRKFLTMREKLEMRKQVLNTHIKAEAIIEGIVVEEQSKKEMEEKLMYQDMVGETESLDINGDDFDEREKTIKLQKRHSESFDEPRRKSQDNKRRREVVDMTEENLRDVNEYSRDPTINARSREREYLQNKKMSDELYEQEADQGIESATSQYHFKSQKEEPRIYQKLRNLKDIHREDEDISESEDEYGESWTGVMEREIVQLNIADINRGLSAKAKFARSQRIQRHEKRFLEKYGKRMNPNALKLMKSRLSGMMSESKPNYVGVKYDMPIPKISGVGSEVLDYLENLEKVRINGNFSFKEIVGRILVGSDFREGSLAMKVASAWRKGKSSYTKPKEYDASELKYWVTTYMLLKKDLITQLFNVEDAEQAIEDLNNFRFNSKISTASITEDCATFQELAYAIPLNNQNQTTVFSAIINAFENFGEDRSQLKNRFSDILINRYGEGYTSAETEEMIEVVRQVLSNQLILTGSSKRRKLMEESVKIKSEPSKKVHYTKKEKEIYKNAKREESLKADSKKEELVNNNDDKKRRGGFSDIKCPLCSLRGHESTDCFIFDKNGKVDMNTIKKWLSERIKKINAIHILKLYAKPFRMMNKEEWDPIENELRSFCGPSLNSVVVEINKSSEI